MLKSRSLAALAAMGALFNSKVAQSDSGMKPNEAAVASRRARAKVSKAKLFKGNSGSKLARKALKGTIGMRHGR